LCISKIITPPIPFVFIRRAEKLLHRLCVDGMLGTGGF
jgi:hypothetical protein